jgi:putative SOS response-associated peptidase YedK
MCGRFAFFSPREAVTAMFAVDFPLELEPRYNIAPTQYVVALRHGDDNAGSPQAAMLRWGLVPSWAKDIAIGNRMINARAETVREKPSFRAAFKRRRCVILADGYYEWRKVDVGKQPYFISMLNSVPFAMAGLWETWEDAGATLDTCTIITTAANKVLAPVHHRMPIVMSPEDARYWMSPDTPADQDLHQFLQSRSNAGLRFWPVSKTVNSPRNDGEVLIEESTP